VIHSFYVPELRLKQDAVPGMNIPVWFEATQTGEWTLGCAELCGLQHYRMRASFFVHTPEEFAAWQASRATPAAGGVGAATAENGDGVALAGSAGAAHVH
jgi:cytochrome c oxidase subunit 2